MTDEELDRETERLFAAARRERPAGVLREQVMRGIARGERARARARKVATFGWAAVAAGVGGLVWLGASAMDGAPNLGAEPEPAGALEAAPELPSVRPAPNPPAVTVAPAPSASASSAAPPVTAAPRATARATPRALSSVAPAPSASVAPEAPASAAPAERDLSRALEVRK